MVVLRDTDPIYTSPTDNIEYTAGTTIDGCDIIYTGPAGSLTDTEISIGQTYYYKIFSYTSNSAEISYSSGVSTNITVNPETVFELTVLKVRCTNNTDANDGGDGGIKVQLFEESNELISWDHDWGQDAMDTGKEIYYNTDPYNWNYTTDPIPYQNVFKIKFTANEVKESSSCWVNDVGGGTDMKLYVHIKAVPNPQ